MNPPTTSTVDQNYFKSPTETIDAYSNRVKAYNDAKPITLQEQQTKANNQGKPGYDILGNAIPGYQAPANTSGTNGGTTNTDANSPTLTDQSDRAALAQTQNDLQTASKKFQDTVTGIQNGSIPLNAGEQAQIDALNQQYQQLITDQQTRNTSAQGMGNVRGYQTGAAEYDPTFQVKVIGDIASKGAAKVAALATEQAGAVSKLTQALKDNDIANIKTVYDSLTTANEDRQKALAQTIKDTQDAIDKANAAAQAVKDYQLNVDKFNQTKDQDAFDNALKTETQAEAERHNKATEATSAFSAGLGAGGGSGVSVTQSAQMGASGPDPVSQKGVLDQITSKYGPMTAVAIKSLANYEMNPADWSTHAGKGMTREQAVTLAKMYDPTYSDTQYPIRAAYLKSIASTQTGTVGNSVNAANKSINHLTAYVNSMEQLNKMENPGDMPGSSSVGNWIGNNITLDPTRRTTIHAAQTEGLGVAEELAKFFKGSGSVDVASIDAWKSQLSTNATHADVQGTTQGAITLLSGQLETLAEQYQSTMGKPMTNNFLNASAMSNLSSLKNQGYTVDIPDVNYTDKDAYFKYGGGTPDNLSKAYQTLVDAKDPNNPPTPENVLELAQLQ